MLGSFLSSYQVNLYIDEGERAEESKLKLKAALTKRRRRLAGVRKGRGFLIPVTLSAENSFLRLSSWPSSYPSTDSFYALPLRKPLRRAEYPPSLECVHSAEAGSNRWPFLAPTPPPALINTFICLCHCGCGLSFCIHPF